MEHRLGGWQTIDQALRLVAVTRAVLATVLVVAGPLCCDIAQEIPKCLRSECTRFEMDILNGSDRSAATVETHICLVSLCGSYDIEPIDPAH